MSAPATSALVRALAARAVHAVLHHGRALDDALEAQRATLPPDDSALLYELTYGTVRWSFTLEAIRAAFMPRPLRAADRDIAALVLVGLYQLRHTRVPAHAAVAQTVDAVAVLEKPWARKLVNALLRRYQREPDVLDPLTSDPVVRYSHPRWLLTALEAAWPQAWTAIVQANNERAPLTLRVNVRKVSRDAYLQHLADAHLAARPGEPDTAIVPERPVPVTALPGFAEGWVSVQDAAAQWAAVLLDAQDGERALDACAAPGGKAAHLLERAPALALTALDKDPARLLRVEQGFARLGLAATTRAADASQPDTWWDGHPYAAILLDAPCSGTGVIRRHPDIKIHRTAADVVRLQATQSALLEALWPLLARGAKLLYATCSVLPSENEEQIMQFRARHRDASEVTLSVPGAVARPAGLQILPGSADRDGFYYACLRKH